MAGYIDIRNFVNVSILNKGQVIPAQSPNVGEKVLIEYDAPGTVVPNTGIVEKVYLNTDLTDEEIILILQNANITSSDYPVLVTSANSGIVIMHYTEDVDGWGILYQTNPDSPNVLWCDENLFSLLSNFPGINITHPGWQEFDNPIEINSEVLSESEIGSKNDLLTTLLSITPFEKATKTLNGIYDGSSIETEGDVNMTALIDEKKIPLNIKVKNDKKSITITSKANNIYCFPEGVNWPLYGDFGDGSAFSEYLLPKDEPVTFKASILVFGSTRTYGFQINDYMHINMITSQNYPYSIAVLKVLYDNALVTINYQDV